ncbi:hypothetical protein DL98DRAFT_91117 [Cadophora sp. DSE1049]|nr:hypothetical protein DL98DRAFT_91117 [Cadophora sp. DSE1049]
MSASVSLFALQLEINRWRMCAALMSSCWVARRSKSARNKAWRSLTVSPLFLPLLCHSPHNLTGSPVPHKPLPNAFLWLYSIRLRRCTFANMRTRPSAAYAASISEKQLKQPVPGAGCVVVRLFFSFPEVERAHRTLVKVSQRVLARSRKANWHSTDQRASSSGAGLGSKKPSICLIRKERPGR